MSPDGERPAARALDELFVRYWDDALDADGLRELNAALAADPAARAAFEQFSLQALTIREQLAVAKAAPAAPRRRARAGAAVAGLLAAGALVIVLGRQPSLGPPVATLEDVAGTVQVSGGGAVAAGRSGQILRSGQTVTLADGENSADVRFRDGTRLMLRADTAVEVADDGQKRVRVARGHLAADVRPQPPDRPMILSTPGAEVRVVGTLLSISGSQRKTDVAVAKGQVVVTRLSDQRSVTLRAGELVTARDGQPLLLQRRPDLPDEYAVDFANLPPDWEAGEPVFDGLPADSAAGLRAAFRHSKGSGVHHLICSNNAWTAGLFELHDDSRLQCRFRLDEPGFFHVLLVARDPAGKVAVFEAPHFFKGRAAGAWHEESVPLRAAKRVGRSAPNLPLPLVVYKVLVDSQAVDRGLTLDRLAVTRDRDPTRPPAAPDRKD